MWINIIELILKNLSEKIKLPTPKDRMAKKLVKLHKAMVECHKEYLHFKHKTTHDLEVWRAKRDDDEFNARWNYWEKVFGNADAWVKAIEKLSDTFYELRDLIGIFNPEVYEIINKYAEKESYAATLAQNHPDIVGFIGRSLPGSKTADPETAVMLQEKDAIDFEIAIEKLRGFIRNDLGFSAEEIFKAL